MRNRLFFTLLPSLLLIAPAAVSAQALAPDSASGPVPQLFEPLSAAPTTDAAPVVRQQAVRVRLDLLAKAASGADGGRLAVDLFGERRILAFRRIESAWGYGWNWYGKVEGDPHGSALISVMGDVCAGSIRVEDRLFRITCQMARQHALQELNESQFSSCGTDAKHAVVSGDSASENVPQNGRQRASSGEIADVMIVYTTDAKNGQGGQASIQALNNLAVAETNQAYENSQVTMRIRLVHQAELTGYSENGNFGTELGRLTDTNDGYFDYIHTWRDTYGADLVAMIVDSYQYCGMAYLMTNVSSSFASSAFSVTSSWCATGYYTFGHELGHNMGCHHDRANASYGAYPYSYGYRTASPQYRTVLAYSPGTRIQYFSNPNVDYLGQALGIAHPSSNSAENWKGLNNASPTIAAWRAAVEPTLVVTGLTGGGTAQAKISGGSFGDSAWVCWSLAGSGPSSTPYGFSLDLSQPIRSLGPASIGFFGSATLTSPVPASATGATAWVQGVLQSGGAYAVTNLVDLVID